MLVTEEVLPSLEIVLYGKTKYIKEVLEAKTKDYKAFGRPSCVVTFLVSKLKTKKKNKNLAYGRHRFSRPIRIVAPPPKTY